MILREVKRLARWWDGIYQNHEETQGRQSMRGQQLATKTESRPGTSRSLAPSKLICIGKSYTYNYPTAEASASRPNPRPEPLLFLKPSTSYAEDGAQVELPHATTGWYEVELCLVIGKRARNVPVTEADNYIEAYTLGLDLAVKEWLDAAKSKGTPWEKAKGLDAFAPMSALIPKELVGDLSDIRLVLKKNGQTVIDGSPGGKHGLIYSPAELVAHASRLMTLETGDIIMTGSPPGIGPFSPGDRLAASMFRRRPQMSEAPKAEDQEEWEVLAHIAVAVTSQPAAGTSEGSEEWLQHSSSS